MIPFYPCMSSFTGPIMLPSKAFNMQRLLSSSTLGEAHVTPLRLPSVVPPASAPRAPALRPSAKDRAASSAPKEEEGLV